MPHDAERLADGNTLIADTGNHRVIEVDYSGTIVWSYETDLYWPYDAERVTSTNNPPDIPNAPSGPDEGFIGTEYEFTAVTTDPDEDQIYYLFDWGDGNDSGWLGPYASGEIGQAFHRWDYAEDYDVKVKAKDIYDIESDWSTTHTIAIVQEPVPVLEIGDITGGLFVISETIKNTGDADVTDVSWSIKLDGGRRAGP